MGAAVIHGAVLVVVGTAVGLLAGTFGIGGGVLAVPALGLLLHLDQHVAEGTSLAAIVPTTAWAAARYARRGLMRWDAAARVGAGALVFGYLGAHAALVLPSRALRLIFAAFVLFLAARSVRASVRPSPAAAPRAPDRAANPPPPAAAGRWLPGRAQAVSQLGIGTVVGLLAGLLGIGGGSIATPALVLLNGFPQQLAQGTTLAAIVLSSLSGGVGYALAGRVDWLAAALLFVGASATVPAGAAIAHRMPEAGLRRAFAILLVAIALLEAAHAV